jgi:hypothetical protein
LSFNVFAYPEREETMNFSQIARNSVILNDKISSKRNLSKINFDQYKSEIITEEEIAKKQKKPIEKELKNKKSHKKKSNRCEIF